LYGDESAISIAKEISKLTKLKHFSKNSQTTERYNEDTKSRKGDYYDE